MTTSAQSATVAIASLSRSSASRSPRVHNAKIYTGKRSSRRAEIVVAVLMVLLVVRSGSAHPLDPLSAEEIDSTIAVLRAAQLTDAATRFPLIDIDEPLKAGVLAWAPGYEIHRSAFVVARRNRVVYEGVVDLTTKSVARWQMISNVQPSILSEELELAPRLTMADPDWQAALRKRGYTTFDKFYCAPLSAGYLANPAEDGRRLLKVVCFNTAGTQNNVWGRPIEGLYALVDVDERKVIQIVDSGVIPVSRDPADFAGSAAPAQTSEGPAVKDLGFTLSGNEVRWKNWSYHFRMDRRVGPILSLVRYDDHGRQRLVLYRGSLAEMFVPYMDPDRSWSFRTYMDVGEYGLGLSSSPLKPGTDCPTDAEFIDATLPDDDGQPVIAKSRICLFERDTARPLWRHAEFSNRIYAGRSEVELVLRTIAAVGNYDYVIDWVLTESGDIRIDVGATGILEAKGVLAESMADPSAKKDTTYGTLVAPNLTAVNHDHFLSFRLDIDVDGPDNTLVRQKLVPQRLTADNGRQSLWRVVDEEIDEEGPLQGAEHGGAEIWRIINPNLTNRLGQHPGYELHAEHSARSLLTPDDFAQRRAAFSGAPLWITAYDPQELYAAGPYPNQSKGGDGLPVYVARHRPVANTDIVLWYTMGFHHVPRPEDWPVMDTMWHSLTLMPDGFFDHNPALDTPIVATPNQTPK
jgi:primary-amine oxidase